MKQSKTLIYSVASVTLLMVGTISLSAAPACQRFVKVYRERIIHHHHISKETAARWAVWGKEHPNYRPKRKPALAPEETLQKVALACDVPINMQQFGELLTPIDEIGLLIPEEAPVYIATAEPVFTLVGTPLLPAPLVPVDDIPTPEPSTLILLGSALGFLVFWKRAKLLATITAGRNLSTL